MLYGDKLVELGEHHVSELSDSVLDWTAQKDREYYGNNGYLLWLLIGSLALAEPLRDAEYSQSILQGRERLFLFFGFEEIFFHLGAVTAEGIVFGSTS